MRLSGPIGETRAIRATPLPTECSWLTPFETRIARSKNCAVAGAQAKTTETPLKSPGETPARTRCGFTT